jgi:histidine triad (HIT) family protein
MSRPNQSQDPECIFCKIIAGQIPCYELHQDERALAFLDIGPLSKAHSLVVPKAHATTIDELSSEDAAACGAILPRLSKAITTATGAPACNILQNNGALAGQAVGHVHFHVIPRFDPAQPEAEEGVGLRFDWTPNKLEADKAQALQSAIRQGL